MPNPSEQNPNVDPQNLRPVTDLKSESFKLGLTPEWYDRNLVDEYDGDVTAGSYNHTIQVPERPPKNDKSTS